MFEIQQLKKTDAARLRQLRLASLNDSPEAFGADYQETAARPMESWIEQLEQMPTFAAVHAGKDIGMARLFCGGERQDTAELISMWVEPGSRRLRVGQQLVGAVVQWARAKNLCELCLCVYAQNEAAASFYGCLGFQFARERCRPSDQNANHRELQMVLKLE